MIGQASACMVKGVAYGDTLPGATTYDDETNLINNYLHRMTIDKITVCQATISSNSYVTGIQIDLLNQQT